MKISLSPFVPENEFSLERRVRPSRPASACSFSTLTKLNLMLTRWISANFRGGGHLYIYTDRHTPSGQSRVYQVTQMRTDGVHCLESAVSGPVVLKVVPVTGAIFAGHHGPNDVRVSSC